MRVIEALIGNSPDPGRWEAMKGRLERDEFLRLPEQNPKPGTKTVASAKYGQAMPEIDLPPKVKDEIRRRSSGSAPWRTPLLIALITLGGGATAAWRRMRKK